MTTTTTPMTQVTVTFSVVQQHAIIVDVDNDFSQVDWDSVIYDAKQSLPQYTKNGTFINATVLDETGVDIAEQDY